MWQKSIFVLASISVGGFSIINNYIYKMFNLNIRGSLLALGIPCLYFAWLHVFRPAVMHPAASSLLTSSLHSSHPLPNQQQLHINLQPQPTPHVRTHMPLLRTTTRLPRLYFIFVLTTTTNTTSTLFTTLFFPSSEPATAPTKLATTTFMTPLAGVWDRIQAASVGVQHATEWATRRTKEYIYIFYLYSEYSCAMYVAISSIPFYYYNITLIN